jgi:hypothetical protein
MTRQALALTALLSLTASFAQAQSCGRCHPRYVYMPYPLVTPHHASTAEESFARGMADVIRAQGLYNLMTSQALIHQAEARRLAIDNRVAYVGAYFTVRDINRQARFGNRSCQYGEAAPVNRPQAHSGERPSLLERAGVKEGQVCWPLALQDEQFAGYRKVVDELVVKAYICGDLSPQDRSTLTQAARAMAGKLKDRIRECKAQDYVEAKQLLIALAT